MLKAVIAILAGMLLLGDYFNKGRASGFVASLRPFDAVIGVLAIVIGILSFFSLLGIALILAGLVLGARALATVPNVGDDLVRAGTAIGAFRILIGAVLLVLGVLRLLGAIL